ncbi:MAG: hydrogenase subunit MbhD domain-containing protein [Spirochaetota bacterium]
MIEAMLGVIVFVAVLSLYVRDLITAVILSSVVSLLSSLVFILLKAPDVALTEAAVGAGVSALVFVWVIHRTERYDRT